MPELPEIETVRRSLKRVLKGQRICGVDIWLAKQVATHTPAEFRAATVGRSFEGFGRRGKYLILELDNRDRLVVHLRMTGQLFVTVPDKPRDGHVHVAFQLSGGKELRYRDVRQFGRLYLLGPEPFSEQQNAPRGLQNLGPEPLGADFGPEEFCARLTGRRAKLKALLLHQDFIAGLGNIYVDEALHRAGLHPERTASTLTEDECYGLHKAIRELLSEAIAYLGTTFSDFRDGYGRIGSFRERLQVYGREGEPCKECGTPLVKVRVAGRGTHFCPECQPDQEANGRKPG